MAYQRANHYEVAGTGITAVIDTTGIGGTPVVSVEVEGRSVEGATLDEGSTGLILEGVVDEVLDKQTLLVQLLVPRVNLDGGPTVVAGLAVLTIARTSIGGPGLVRGPVHLYEVRPLAVSASLVAS